MFPSSMYDGYGTYSLSLCPNGYKTVQTSIVESSITAAQCCPSGYWWDGVSSDGDVAECTTSYTTPTLVAVSISGQSVMSSVGPGVRHKFMIAVFYQSKDMSLFPAGYVPGSEMLTIATTYIETRTVQVLPSTSQSLAPIQTGASSNLTDLPEGQDGGGGLSVGAKAGIGAGVGVVAIAILAALIFLFLHRRKQASAITPVLETEYFNPLDKPKLDASLGTSKMELDGTSAQK
ncbi:hypothetical protein B0H63DRAFT_531042 [Podospora didyma]|uniref:Uncharacterized protein n=1 Tax=Podospora didyma TaxID=330526 RepID=A0AAE0P5G1_9PEZI|nr:hypothetical protein B0H63DRAFT_531042 [Podospora didyma]